MKDYHITRADVAQRAQNETWAILPGALQTLLAADPVANDTPDLQAVVKPGPRSGRVAIVPIQGAITRRESFWSMFFGGAAVETLTAQLRTLAQDSTVGTVILSIDSPGGTVSGLPELAAEVRKLRDSKRVVAVADSLMASAAYWIGSQADEIVASPEALVGSIGVFTLHEDWSAALEQMGVKTTYIAAGKYKVEGNPTEPLSDEARQHLQGLVDSAYNLFVADVAAGRGVTAAQVKADYGQGRVLSASEAKAAGLIDRVATFDETVKRLAGLKSEDMQGVRLARVSNMRRRLELAEKI